MHDTVKAFFFVFILGGILTLTPAQEVDSTRLKSDLVPDSAAAKDSSFGIDTSSIKDTTVLTPLNKDSISVRDSLALMKTNFDQFKYADVISIANKLLLRKVPLTKDEILNVYKFKGISHYSLSEDDAAKKSFIEILRIDTSYTLDSTKTSPKIISFFNQVKQNYAQQQKDIEARTVVRLDTIYVPKIQYDIGHENRLKNAIARSLIIPGLGHLYLDVNFKSVFLTVLGSAALISSVYYSLKTEEKHKSYLVETDPGKIEMKYNDYNDLYSKRNISLVSFGVLWIYSQLDILFFMDDESENNLSKNASIDYNDLRGLTFHLSYSF